MPRAAVELLARILAHTATGQGVSIVPAHAELTTGPWDGMAEQGDGAELSGGLTNALRDPLPAPDDLPADALSPWHIEAEDAGSRHHPPTTAFCARHHPVGDPHSHVKPKHPGPKFNTTPWTRS
ncbi:hypothetical protein ACFQ1S_41190, partial [Kibdelosporangium lantanae]